MELDSEDETVGGGEATSRLPPLTAEPLRCRRILNESGCCGRRSCPVNLELVPRMEAVVGLWCGGCVADSVMGVWGVSSRDLTCFVWGLVRPRCRRATAVSIL